jgi:hypothetical protein
VVPVEYVVVTKWGEVVAGPFASEDEARGWIYRTHDGITATSRWGHLFVAARQGRNESPGWVAVFNSRSEVPGEVWSLQGSGDLIVEELPHGFMAVYAVTAPPEVIR